jgi:hypothetical protein
MQVRRPNTLQSAILHAFRPVTNREVAQRLRAFALRDWQRLGSWLQASGLGLYFGDTLRVRAIEDAIPGTMRQELSQNLADNRERMRAMQAEFLRLNKGFREADLDALNVKGFTLGPEYCPKPAVRQQFDLDFWMRAEDAARCKAVLTGMGYVIHDAGHVLECRTAGTHTPKLRDFYKPPVQYAVEIHLLPAAKFAGLDRSNRVVEGRVVQTLSREQIFLNHALHIAKHLRSEWTRASWMLELRNAIRDTERDVDFWRKVRQGCAASDAAAFAVAIGASAQVLEFPVPVELASWTTDALSGNLRRWILQFAEEVVTAPFPGTKLYLLLERELRRDDEKFRAQRHSALMPMRVPGFMTASSSPRGLRGGLGSAQYAATRLRFHVSQGIKFLRAERTWMQHEVGAKECVGNKGESVA